jgi:hypothetical protein
VSLGAPLQPLRCANPSCQLPSGGRCARGAEFADPIAGCPELARLEGPPGGSGGAPPLGGALSVAWTGAHLSMEEGLALSRAALTRVVSVVGAADAGKTSLLTSLFLQLANGAKDGFPWRVAGSRSLRSFEALVQAVRAYSGAFGEQSTPHTPRVDGDGSTFLHLALVPSPERAPDAAGALRADGVVREVVLSDISGERFTELARHESAENRARVRFLEHSDVVFVLIDAAGLREPSGPRADRDAAALLERVAELVAKAGHGGQLRVVFTKCDRLGTDFEPAQVAVDEAWVTRALRAPRLTARIRGLSGVGALAGMHTVTAFPGPLCAGHPGGLSRLFGTALAAVERAPHPVVVGDLGGGRIRRWDR